MMILKNYLKNRLFLRNVLTLITGTAFSQVLMIIAMPLLTRLYTPADFGIYAMFIALSSVMSVMAAGRYELAIILPKEKKDGMNILFLCIVLTALITLGLYVFLYFMGRLVLEYFDQLLLIKYIYIFPIAVFLAAIYQIFYYWFNREKKFVIMTKARVYFSFVNILSGLFIGYIYASPWGLIFAMLIGQCIAVCYMGMSFIKTENIKVFSLKMALDEAKRYKNCPRFLMLGHAIGGISQQLPIFLLTSFYGSDIVGYFSLGQRCINMPISLITQSVGDVFRQAAVKEYNTNGECKDLFNKTFKKLFLVSIPPLAILMIFAPTIFELFFGLEWRKAGIYTQILVPMYLLQCVTSPLSNMFLIAEKQKMDFGVQIGIVLILFIFMHMGNVLFGDDEITISFFCIGYIIIYIVVLYISKKYAGGIK